MDNEKKTIKIRDIRNPNINTEAMYKLRKSFIKALKPMTEAILEMSFFQKSLFTDEFKEALETFKKQFEDLPEHIKFFSKHGWIVYGEFPAYVVKEFGKYCEKNNFTYKEEEKELLEYYIKNISKTERQNIIDRLMKRSILKDRKKILNEIKFACEKEKYYIGSVALVSTIEGILSAQINLNEWISQGKIKSKIKELTAKSEIDTASLFYIIEKKFYDGFGAGKKSAEPNDISRNGILHGIDINCGTEGTFLKLLLLLNTTSRVLSNV